MTSRNSGSSHCWVPKSFSLSLAGNWETEMADTMPNTLLWLAWLLLSESGQWDKASAFVFFLPGQ